MNEIENLIHYANNRLWLEGTVEDPKFETTPLGLNWQSYIPVHIKRNWHLLSHETRAIAALIASNMAEKEWENREAEGEL